MSAALPIARDRPALPIVHGRYMRAVVTRLWQGGLDTVAIAKRTGMSEPAIYNFLAQRREG